MEKKLLIFFTKTLTKLQASPPGEYSYLFVGTIKKNLIKNSSIYIITTQS